MALQFYKMIFHQSGNMLSTHTKRITELYSYSYSYDYCGHKSSYTV